MSYRLVLRVEAGVDDAVHVQVEVVEVNGGGATSRTVFFLDGGGDDVGVLLHEPPVERRHSHGGRLASSPASCLQRQLKLLTQAPMLAMD